MQNHSKLQLIGKIYKTLVTAISILDRVYPEDVRTKLDTERFEAIREDVNVVLHEIPELEH